MFYRQPIDWRKKDQVVIDAIQSVLAKSPQSGFWKCYFRLRFQGYPFNHKRVYRVYCRLGLNLKRRVKKVLPKREKRPLMIEKIPNIQWDWILCTTVYIAVSGSEPSILLMRKRVNAWRLRLIHHYRLNVLSGCLNV